MRKKRLDLPRYVDRRALRSANYPARLSRFHIRAREITSELRKPHRIPNGDNSLPTGITSAPATGPTSRPQAHCRNSRFSSGDEIAQSDTSLPHGGSEIGRNGSKWTLGAANTYNREGEQQPNSVST